ncbi:response regulator transcription factor [Rarobacter faecitabidus]|uniref:LuxR family two component transcriptional regulator n=1 Tax=Rarobacter faecitabidus TaxID=13243 RepID=A0A542ZU25_RARFA|nr:response regulator transcription factor [Rarobacter faecitabidus]TQL63864.1 LuxR family two component transcriptional regulator [Rarobacter faecitabidus]
MTSRAEPEQRDHAAIRVAVVDDQALVRAGFAMVINSQPDMTVTTQASDGDEAIRLLGAGDTDVVLMDVRMPVTDGIEATERLTELWREVASPARVIMLTTFDIDEYAIEAIHAGASGFLLKDAPPEEMLNAIRTIHRGDAVLAPSTTRRLIERLASTQDASSSPAPTQDTARLAELTEREREVLVLVAGGLTNQEIASELVVAEATVKTHLGRILAKLGLRDRVQAVILAYECGLVSPGGAE